MLLAKPIDAEALVSAVRMLAKSTSGQAGARSDGSPA
jgi:hypothetical protein